MIMINEATNDVDFERLQSLKNIWRFTRQVDNTISAKHFSIRLTPDVYLSEIHTQTLFQPHR